MVKILDNAALEKILAESTSAYFFQKVKEKETREGYKSFYEKDGSVIVTFKTGMAQIEPGEKDLIEQPWIPKLKDNDGNPILDTFGANKGNPRKAWDKFEAKAIINGTETVYGFGGKNGILLKGFVAEMMKNKIKNPELPSTKWKIKCIPSGRFNTWDIEFLGKGEVPKVKPKKIEVSSNYDKVVKAVSEIKEGNASRVLAGIGKVELAGAIAYKSKLSEKEVEKVFPQLEENGVINITGDKVYIQ